MWELGTWIKAGGSRTPLGRSTGLALGYLHKMIRAPQKRVLRQVPTSFNTQSFRFWRFSDLPRCPAFLPLLGDKRTSNAPGRSVPIYEYRT
jgi:hypothetical protein